MTTEILNKEIVNYIINDVELTIKRLGINVQLSIEQCEDYNHDKFDKIVSTSFQTMPMLFKEIHIEGDINVITRETEEDNCKVIINLDVRYTHFDGGTNGHNLGKITYLADKSYKGRNTKHINMYVNKVKSLAI
jgi:hypothetical protein|uniref:hypothetical protein n=1 Tax=Prevotella sp. TaxID=59823 RepID=UPI0040299197